MKQFLVIFAVCLAISNAQNEVDVNRLFHSALPPTAIPPSSLPLAQDSVTPAPAPHPAVQTSTNIPNDLLGEIDGVFVPYRNSRHDEFDWALTKNVLNTKKENTVLSPFLVKLLLSILAEAAGESTSTHRELTSILPSVQTTAETRELYGKAFGSLLQQNPDYQLELGARLYVDKFIQPRQRFQAIIKTFYFSDVETVDFANSLATANLINAWCSNATKNHITDIVNPDDVAHAVILLLNTIYFNGYWRQPFPENQTSLQTFHVDAKTDCTVPFMFITADFHYLESKELNSKILRLPYKGYKFAMYIVLPNKVDGLDELLNKIDTSTLHRAQFLLEEIEVKVSLPKFKFTNSINLNEVLQNLGIQQMFTNRASFPLLARGAGVQDRLQVSNVLQKTGIEINEKGSTAFAATQISLTNKFGGEYEFNVNRPFLFLIEDETTGTLIFSGKVLKPDQ